MSDLIIELKNINVVFDLDLYCGEMLRDVFVRYLSSPSESIRIKKKKIHVLQDISFSLQKGDRLGIIGMNGSGKTTLCRTISGMYQPLSGTIDRRGTVRAIFDSGVGIQEELTGRENAYLLCRLLFPHIKDVDDVVGEALEFSELGDFVDVPYRNYSKGMQARLCLSLISKQPANLILLDEVFDGADKHFSQKISKRFLDMIKASGAVIFITHDLAQLLEVCNKVGVMNRGKLEYLGDVEEGIKYYQHLLNDSSKRMSFQV